MTRKIAISLPDATLQRAQIAVKRGRAPNVSNYITLLIDQESESESFDAMIADFVRASGASESELRAAEAQTIADFERAGLITRRKKPAAVGGKVESRRRTG